jgi:hypothetical protein
MWLNNIFLADVAETCFSKTTWQLHGNFKIFSWLERGSGIFSPLSYFNSLAQLLSVGSCHVAASSKTNAYQLFNEITGSGLPLTWVVQKQGCVQNSAIFEFSQFYNLNKVIPAVMIKSAQQWKERRNMVNLSVINHDA